MNPTNSSNGFLGANSAVNTAEIDFTIAECSATVVDRLPPRYKRLATYIDGEWLFGGSARKGVARGGEFVFTTGLQNISNLTLYKNYSGRWRNRSYADEMLSSEFTFVPATGMITLSTALNAGDKLIAVYNHDDLERCLTLKNIAMGLIVSYWAKILFTGEDKLATYMSMETQSYVDLGRIKEDKGYINLKFFDDLELVNETLNDKTSGVASGFFSNGMR